MPATVDLTNPIFTNLEAARKHFEAIRWPQGACCPFCGSFDRVAPLGGKSMGPGWYHCKDCRKKFTAAVGTIYERSHIPMTKWLLATHLMCASKKGMPGFCWRLISSCSSEVGTSASTFSGSCVRSCASTPFFPRCPLSWPRLDFKPRRLPCSLADFGSSPSTASGDGRFFLDAIRCPLKGSLFGSAGLVKMNSTSSTPPEGRLKSFRRYKPGKLTVARMLKDAGYTTALIGEWGLGEIGSEGEPNRQGFDQFYGVVNQTHAHNHYPDFVWRNREKIALSNVVTPVGTVPGAGYATTRVQYANDLFFQEAAAFVQRTKDRPFFLFLSLTVPHANNERARALGDGQEVPDYGPYASKDWAGPLKGQAAMLTRMDGYVGELLAQLKSLGIDDRTLVMFTSDNGPHKEGGRTSRSRPCGRSSRSGWCGSRPERGSRRDGHQS